MSTQTTPSKGFWKNFWKDSPIKIAFAWVLFAAGMIGVGFIVNAASNEDKRQEAYSNRYYVPAVQDYEAHRYQVATVKLQANLRAYPDDYKANFEMGLVLLELGKKQAARVYFVDAQNSFLSHHGRFSKWTRYDLAQRQIDKIDQPQKWNGVSETRIGYISTITLSLPGNFHGFFRSLGLLASQNNRQQPR